MAHDLNDTLIFVKVVEQGSFIAAATALGLPKTTVSRKVQELETRLGARLLHRTTRRLGLTEAGSVYHEHCQRIARELEEAEGAVNQLQSGPRGWLRFTVPYSIASPGSRRCWASSMRSTRKSSWTCTWVTKSST